jgi:3-hydroxybutyryl-CoA dehydrogenase
MAKKALKDMRIAAYGGGRMGRGIGICFALAGAELLLIDSRPRDDWAAWQAAAKDDIGQMLSMLAALDLLHAEAIETLQARIHCLPHEDGLAALAECDLLFEAVPETEEAKKQAFAQLDTVLPEAAIIASTTSTFLADLVASWSAHPERVLNAHFLNPAFLVPLVEVSPHEKTDKTVTARLTELLEEAGKVPVICKASPGYIVPRIQALAMNEAARLVEEGVASAEDIDKAVRYGFGLRFAVLGLLEFIDWGGLDILYYASAYMQREMQQDRFAAPAIVAEKMQAGETGMSAGKGIYDWQNRDQDNFKLEKMRQFAEMLKMNGVFKPPVLPDRHS